jgi:hypothetical protein
MMQERGVNGELATLGTVNHVGAYSWVSLLEQAGREGGRCLTTGGAQEGLT